MNRKLSFRCFSRQGGQSARRRKGNVQRLWDPLSGSRCCAIEHLEDRALLNAVMGFGQFLRPAEARLVQPAAAAVPGGPGFQFHHLFLDPGTQKPTSIAPRGLPSPMDAGGLPPFHSFSNPRGVRDR